MRAVSFAAMGLLLAGAAMAQQRPVPSPAQKQQAAPPQAGQTASAQLQDKAGKNVGMVKLTQMPKGVLLRVEASGLTPGWHAIHIHGVGKCEGNAQPPFGSAGGHFNPGGQKHGFGQDGSHAGDLPNIFADAQGKAVADVMAMNVSMIDQQQGYLFGPNGTAIVIHAGPDDYASDPAGNSGDRVACGIVQKG